MFRTLAIAGLLCAGQALASSTQVLCPTEGAEREAGIDAYSVYRHGGGFVLYVTWQEDVRMFLDDCNGQKRLVMRLVEGKNLRETLDARHAVFGAVLATLDSEEKYTMREVGRIARRAGAKTSIGTSKYESCGCKHYGEY